MLYCNACDKEVVIYGVSPSAITDMELENLLDQTIKEGRIILFNPPPFGIHACPQCGTELEERII